MSVTDRFDFDEPFEIPPYPPEMDVLGETDLIRFDEPFEIPPAPQEKKAMSETELIRFVCPFCHKRLKIKSSATGKQIRCANVACGRSITVPKRDEPSPKRVEASPKRDETAPKRVEPSPKRVEASVPKMQPSQSSPEQEALAQVAIQDRDWMASEAAAKQLTDQTLIAKVARTAQDETARIAAVLKLEDAAVLAQIAKSDQNDVVRRAAARMLAKRTPVGEDELKRIRSASEQRQGLLPRCGGCGSQEKARLEVVLDKNHNRGFLCEPCVHEYLLLLRNGSDRRFWQCGQCTFRILAGTRIDAAVDPESACPHCRADVNVSLVNLNNDRPVASGMMGEPLE